MKNLVELLNKYSQNSSQFSLKDISEGYEMTTENFLDVYGTRYEISLDMGNKILGLKEVLQTISNINENKIKSFSVVNEKIDILVYTDLDITQIYGVIDFLGNFVNKGISN